MCSAHIQKARLMIQYKTINSIVLLRPHGKPRMLRKRGEGIIPSHLGDAVVVAAYFQRGLETMVGDADVRALVALLQGVENQIPIQPNLDPPIRANAQSHGLVPLGSDLEKDKGGIALD